VKVNSGAAVLVAIGTTAALALCVKSLHALVGTAILFGVCLGVALAGVSLLLLLARWHNSRVVALQPPLASELCDESINVLQQFISQLPYGEGSFVTSQVKLDWQQRFTDVVASRDQEQDLCGPGVTQVRASIFAGVYECIKRCCASRGIAHISFNIDLQELLDEPAAQSSLRQDLFRLISVIPPSGGEPIMLNMLHVQCPAELSALQGGDTEAISTYFKQLYSEVGYSSVEGEEQKSLIDSFLHQGIFTFLLAAGADICKTGAGSRSALGGDSSLTLDMHKHAIRACLGWQSPPHKIEWQLEVDIRPKNHVGRVTITAGVLAG